MPHKLRRRFFYHWPRIRYFLVGILAGILLLGVFKIAPATLGLLQNISLGSSIFWSVVTDRPLSLKEDSGMTNILLLGKAGGNHEGANLTDTMIFASVNLKSYKVTLLSLPRDIWIPSLESKLNTAYEMGEEKKPGGGITLTKAAVSDILGQPIHYLLVIDFSGFTKIIDLLGGVEIDVENTFDDFKYPITGKENDSCEEDPEYLCRYEHLHFDRGLEHMNGDRALKYVRSRQAEGDEGTDFARSKRQQKVLLALKTKILSTETLLNPGKLLALKKELADNITTDISTSEIGDFLKIVRKVNLGQITTLILDTGDKEAGRDGFLMNPPTWEYDGSWVLVPRTGDWGEVQRYLSSQLSTP